MSKPKSAAIPVGCNYIESLSGIETWDFDFYPTLNFKVATILNPYQGLKLI